MVKDRKQSQEKKTEQEKKVVGDTDTQTCPECGAPIQFGEGCFFCPFCGYSKCG